MREVCRTGGNRMFETEPCLFGLQLSDSLFDRELGFNNQTVCCVTTINFAIITRDHPGR